MPLTNQQQLEIQRATHILQQGGLVAIPTETVYGLAANAMDSEAVKKIFALKGRPADHPLIVHIASADFLSQWAKDIPEIAYQLAAQFWPGPLTLILNKRDDLHSIVTGGQNTIGLRCPNNTLTLELLRQFAGGLAAPSANRFGHVSPTTAQHVRDEFADQTPMILDGGACNIGIESTIVDLSQTPARILRPGQISFEQLQTYIPDLQQGAQVNSPRVSGDLLAHYAPRTALAMLNRPEILQLASHRNIVTLCLNTLPEDIKGIAVENNSITYAQQLYANLRLLDQQNAEQIVIEQIPNSNEWLAIADRLKRAITGSGKDLT